jgi:hypothetical protein
LVGRPRSLELDNASSISQRSGCVGPRSEARGSHAAMFDSTN